ncbi:MAG: M23 family metallopeptidase [Bacillota bacterium]
MPLWVGQLTAAIFVLGLAGFCVLAYVYRTVSQEAHEARILRQVNQVQQEEINAFAYETQKLLEQMVQIEDLAELVAEKLGIDLDQVEDELDTSSQAEVGEAERYYANRSGEGRVLDRAAENIAVLQHLMPEQSDSLEMLKGEVEEYVRRLAATPSIWPAWGRYTSGFGMRVSPFNRNLMEFHSGIDIAASYGSAIYATADGRITATGYRGGWGNLITISHGYGFETYYAHLSGYAVSTGQWVKRGQVIGYMGRSGNVTGTHLHYEVHVNTVAVNPMNYIR